MRNTFFDRYGASELGTTKILTAGLVQGTRGQEQKMIDVSTEDDGACPIIVSVRVEYQNDPTTGVPSIGGPIVGRVQWGVGGGENQVEFDVPSARLPTALCPMPGTELISGTADNVPMLNIGNGVQIYLGPASHVSLYLRHDGNMSSLINPGADHIGSTTPAKVIAFVGPAESGGKPPVERTIYAVGGITDAAPSQMTPAAFVNISVPPFAKEVRMQRTPSNLPVDVLFVNNFGWIYRRISLATNQEGPVPIDCATEQLRIINTAGANIVAMQAVFDVTPV